MTRLIKSIVASLAALAILPAISDEAQAEKPKPSKVLMVTQSAGYRHGSVFRRDKKLAPAEISMTQLGQQSGLFSVVSTQDCKLDFTKENLDKFDIVMFYTTGKLPIAKEDMDYFLNTWLKQKGKGFIGFHSASDTYKDFEPYWDFVGGTFNGHPWGSGSDVVMTIHDTSHPAMKPFGEELEWKDEIYQYKNWQPAKVHVLMSLNMAKTKTKKPYHVPVAWCKNWGEGKMFYNNMGHREDTWTKKPFLDSVIGAVKWIRGEAKGNADPNPEVSAAEEEKAKAAAGK